MECAIVGPHLAAASELVRVDVIVRDLPTEGRLRVRLERLWPDPGVHIDECKCPAPRAGTATYSFLWRPTTGADLRGPVVLRASVWGRRMLCASTHGVRVMPDGAPCAMSDEPSVPGRRSASA